MDRLGSARPPRLVRSTVAVGLIAAGAITAGAIAAGAASPALRAPAAKVASPKLGDLTTYHYDNARSGRDPVAGAISSLARGWDDSAGGRALDGAVYGEPLVYDGLVVVATENDSVYALRASTGAVLWRRHLGTPVVSRMLPCGDISPLGITGTPVIEARAAEVFAAAEVSARVGGRSVVEHVLAALSLSSGKVRWQRVIDPPGNGRVYQVAAEQQRGALTLANGRVYVPLGGLYGDCGTYHGYVLALPETGKGALESYRVPTHDAGAIWETDGAVVSAGGDLYVATGNSFDGPGTPFDFGDAVIELSPSLKQLGYFAPADWAQLNAGDLDLGSGGPIEVPGTKLLFEEGKADNNGVGVGYLLYEGRLGGIAHPAFAGTACPNGGSVFGADAAAVVGGRTYVYVACSGGTEAIAVTAGKRPSFRRSWSPSSCDPNGPPIVAGGLVWAIGTGADGGGGPANELCGMRPASGKVVVTQSLDSVEHFVSPAVGDGMMLVPTSGGVEAFRTR